MILLNITNKLMDLDDLNLDLKYNEADPPIIKQLKKSLYIRERNMIDTEDIFEHKTDIGIPISDEEYNAHEENIDNFMQDIDILRFEYKKYALFSEMNKFFKNRNLIKKQLIMLEQSLCDKLNLDVLANIGRMISGIKGSLYRQINFL